MNHFLALTLDFSSEALFVPSILAFLPRQFFPASDLRQVLGQAMSSIMNPDRLLDRPVVEKRQKRLPLDEFDRERAAYRIIQYRDLATITGQYFVTLPVIQSDGNATRDGRTYDQQHACRPRNA